MSTDTTKVAAMGARLRGPYLVQQAGYTLGIAEAEGQPMVDLLPNGHVEKTAKLRDEVQAALQDKTILGAEARHATNEQNAQMHACSVWIRKAGKRCQNAIHLGIVLPPDMIRTSSSTTVPGMLEQMSRELALLGEQASAMDAVGPRTQPLIDEGRKLFQSLQQADSTQEQVRASELPAAVLNFLVKKAELYLALKVINNAGHELYAHDLASAAKFNMSILNRRGSGGSQPEPVKPTPPADKTA